MAVVEGDQLLDELRSLTLAYLALEDLDLVSDMWLFICRYGA